MHAVRSYILYYVLLLYTGEIKLLKFALHYGQILHHNWSFVCLIIRFCMAALSADSPLALLGDIGPQTAVHDLDTLDLQARLHRCRATSLRTSLSEKTL